MVQKNIEKIKKKWKNRYLLIFDPVDPIAINEIIEDIV